jgi:hypothetical protein
MLNPKRLAAALLLGSAIMGAHGASALTKDGSEYRILPSLPGDQSLAQFAFGPDGGYLVTQDNSIDGNGLGIRARKFYGDLTAAQNSFQVNANGLNDQQRPRVALLKGGGAVFAWESSTATGHRVFLRFLDSNGVLSSEDVPASRIVAGSQSDASLAVLTDGTVCVVWAEQDRDGSMDGIFGQLLTPTGAKLGGTFQVNQKSSLSQRTPSVAALENGKFAVSWITDENRAPESIDIYARVFNADGTAAGGEFPVNTWKYKIVDGKQVEVREVSANPFVAAIPGGFRAAWSKRPYEFSATSWDVKTRTFDLQGQSTSEEILVNNTTQGDQFSPRIAVSGDSQLIVWTSFGQDGSDEGIYARALKGSGDFDGDEFLVNTRTVSKQVYPAVTGVGSRGFVVAWSSFVGGVASYDLFAQNYSLPSSGDFPAPVPPFVSSLSQNSILVSWSDVTSDPGSSYSVYVDGDATPLTTTAGMLTITRDAWVAASTHTVRLSYSTPSAKTSALSDAVSVKTWGADLNGDGLPDDWQQLNFGKLRPSPNEDTDGDGATNLEEFLAGTDPTDPASVLRTRISAREQGLYIEWNAIAGNYYQLQVTSDFSSWSNIGTPRFAHSDTDSLPCTGPGQVRYYRVIRMR